MLAIGPGADLQGACKCHASWVGGLGPFTPLWSTSARKPTHTQSHLKTNLTVDGETTVVTQSYEGCPREEGGIAIIPLQYPRRQDVVK